MTRTDVEFPSGDSRCGAWLYLPETGPRPPVIVMAHGLGAVRAMRLDVYAERFCAAGYACLVFDYRHFGTSGGEPRQLLDVREQLQDWAAAIAHARSRADVDGDRVILWGTSFGGGHVIAAAAADPAVAAAIAQCPFTDSLASVLAMSPLASLKVTALALADLASGWLGRPPVMVATAGAPGSTALMTAPDAEPGYLALVPEDLDFDNHVAARIGVKVLGYSPGRRAREVRCPILFCVCDTDSVAPAAATLRHAKTAPRGEIRRYPEGHFDIYVGEAFERVIADQLEFLRRQVPAGPPQPA